MELTSPEARLAARYGIHEFRPAGLIIGVDLGQQNDFTAIAVVEVTKEVYEVPHDRRERDKEIKRYALRHAQRLPLGTSYPDVAGIVGKMVASLSTTTRTTVLRPDLVVDATGVGRPVIDMMEAAGLHPIAVSITGGREVNRTAHDSYTVPKRHLVSSLIVAFQEERLKLAAGIPAIAELQHELLNFKARISASGHESFDAWRESIHDDLVLATALAVWFGESRPPPAQFFPLHL